MPYINEFDSFDPIRGKVPEYPITCLPDIARRARAVLVFWDKEQVVLAAHKISDLIDNYFERVKDLKIYTLQTDHFSDDEVFDKCFEWDGGDTANGRWFFKDSMLNELGVPTDDNTSKIDALKLVLEERDSSCIFLDEKQDIEPFQYEEGKDYELFAVLSLWLLIESISWSQSKSKFSHISASAYAIEAMEAVCYAEHLKASEWLVSYAKSTASKELAIALRRQKMENASNFKAIQQEIDNKIRRFATERAKNAVSQRPDQKLKPDWIAHCTKMKRTGVIINRLDDLLNTPGYDPSITSIAPRTLKLWAAEVGIFFKPGRPKK